MKKIILITGLLFVTMVFSKTKTEKIILTKDNTVAFFGEVNQTTVNEVVSDVKKLNSTLPSGDPIYLVLNTPGGEVETGLELISFLNSLNRPVHTITLFAASMGFQFVQNLGKRYILEYGTLMSHKVSGGFSGSFGSENSQLDSRYTLWLRKIRRLDLHTVSRTNGKQTLKTYRAAYENELWLNGWEAVQQGYADNIANVSCDTTLKGTREVHFKSEKQNIIATFDACPLLTSVLQADIVLKTNHGTMTHRDFINKDGKFGVDCPLDNKKILCAKDTTISLKKINSILKNIKQMFKNIKGQVNKNKMKLSL